ncbi:hypothetical protein [Motilimonas pumila]|uniref:CopL family metal-binding regulatory protein n=1 Tax=Motilimonas pumila TaxID=2303987 RepID=A0A418YEB9_9GAMM|nr:hypothetical protein [Motilimonas pumila]RJG47480.1 hypothetical protein D1Z90_11245 [Motilimonas pumila]
MGFKLFMVLALTFASVTNSFAAMPPAADAHQPVMMSEHCDEMAAMSSTNLGHMNQASEMDCDNTCTTCCMASCALSPVILSQHPERTAPFPRRMTMADEPHSLTVQVKPDLYRPPIS